MATNDGQSDFTGGARKEGQETRPESFRRRKARAETSANLHLRGSERKSTGLVKGQRSSTSLATTHAVSNAVTEFYWRNSAASKIDLSKELERGLPTTGPSGEKLYILGAEFAITAIVAAVAIARRRADLSSATLPSVSKLKSEADRESHFSMVKIILEDETGAEDAIASGADDDAPPGRKSDNKASGKNVARQTEVERNSYLYGSSTSRPTVTITLSDTLVSIAQRQYHDGNVGWLIADLNRSKLRETKDGGKRVVEVADGESLELPIWKEIVAFYQRKLVGACAENLITIVISQTADRDIVDAVLSPIVDPRKNSQV